MSDYTPTTEEVSKPSLRERIREQLPQTTAEFRTRLSIYAVETTGGQVSGFKRSEELAELFDLWLAEVKAQEAKAERERIKQRLWDDGYLYEMERDHVWALIEGETE